MTSPTEVGDPAQGLVNCPRCGDPLLCIRVSGGWLRVCEIHHPPGPRRTNPALDPKPVVPRDVCVATVDRCG
jgi:hypothetical protein